MSIKKTDLSVLTTLLSPEYLIPLSERYGGGDAVLGAKEAWQDVRAACREYIRYIRWRDQITSKDLELALLFRSLGWIQNHQHVIQVPPSEWRETAKDLWPTGGEITGEIQVNTNGFSQSVIDKASIIALSNTLKRIPSVNRAFLQNRCWQRTTPEVMFNFELRGEVRSAIFNASGRDIDWLERKITRALISAKRVQKHELSYIGPQMLREWSQYGFISSPAGAMIATVGLAGVYKGKAPLIDCNGIPISVVVGKVVDDRVWLTFAIDHRCIDGRAAGRLYQSMAKEIGRLL